MISTCARLPAISPNAQVLRIGQNNTKIKGKHHQSSMYSIMLILSSTGELRQQLTNPSPNTSPTRNTAGTTTEGATTAPTAWEPVVVDVIVPAKVGRSGGTVVLSKAEVCTENIVETVSSVTA